MNDLQQNQNIFIPNELESNLWSGKSMIYETGYIDRMETGVSVQQCNLNIYS